MYRVLIRQGWDGQEQLINNDNGDFPRLLAGQITKAVGSYDTFSMTLSPKGYDQIAPRLTFVRVIRTQPMRVLFEGRVCWYQPTMSNEGQINKSVSLEGLEAFLHDSVQPWAVFHDTTPKAFLQALIYNHNAQVEPYKQMKLGTVTVTNSTDNVYRYTDDSKDTYDTIQDKLIGRLGGEMRVRRESDGLYLDYMPMIGQQANQVIRLQSNLLSLSSKIDPTDVITVLKPLGATQQSATTDGDDTTDGTESSNPRLTIDSVNNDSPFLIDQALVDRFGIRVGAVTWDNVTLPKNLLSTGQAWLAAQKAAIETVQLSAVDLSLIGRQVDDFLCGNSYRVVNPLMSFDKTLRFVGQMIDIVAPFNSTVTAGDLALSAEDYTLTMYRAAQKVTVLENSYEGLSKAAQNAQKSIVAMQKTVGDIQEQAESAGLSGLGTAMGQINNQLTEIFANVGEVGGEVSALQQTTADHEERIGIIEVKVGIVPAEGGQ